MSRAFTLIELLVVVTIIVVLMALLAPALDKAIYHAELTACGARLDAAAAAVVSYALAHKRVYPTGEARRTAGYQPDLIGWRNNDANIRQDVRPALRGWVDLKWLLCPLSPAIDLEIEANDADAQVFANYDLWFGWQYVGQEPMGRMGQRFGAHDTTTGTTYSFNVLLSDKSMEHLAGSSQTSHPDRLGRNRNDHYQNETINYQAQVFEVYYGGTKVTQSRWRAGPGPATRRGLLDLNFAMGDGSVLRADNVEMGDDRLKPAPAHANDYNPVWDIMLPQ